MQSCANVFYMQLKLGKFDVWSPQLNSMLTLLGFWQASGLRHSSWMRVVSWCSLRGILIIVVGRVQLMAVGARDS